MWYKRYGYKELSEASNGYSENIEYFFFLVLVSFIFPFISVFYANNVNFPLYIICVLLYVLAGSLGNITPMFKGYPIFLLGVVVIATISWFYKIELFGHLVRDQSSMFFPKYVTEINFNELYVFLVFNLVTISLGVVLFYTKTNS